MKSCADGLPAVLAPPVSASNRRVYFRDGDTKISYLATDGHKGDVTTVPGSPTTISFFSVSPDDMRIAVVVEDLSPAANIGLGMYVEDLNGGGHHVDIFNATITKGANGMTLWPSGWHQGELVVAVVPACSASPILHPAAWHVIDPATGATKVNIDVSSCRSGLLPSPAGIACFNAPAIQIQVIDWTGTQTYSASGPFLDLSNPVGLSPSGQDLFFNQTDQMWASSISGGGSMKPISGHPACNWINDSSIMATDAAIAYPAGTVSTLPANGICAGRFPGGL